MPKTVRIPDIDDEVYGVLVRLAGEAGRFATPDPEHRWVDPFDDAGALGAAKLLARHADVDRRRGGEHAGGRFGQPDQLGKRLGTHPRTPPRGRQADQRGPRPLVPHPSKR